MSRRIEVGLTARQAIELSCLEARTVHLAYTDALAAELFADCETVADSEDVREYWGARWRVHLHKEA